MARIKVKSCPDNAEVKRLRPTFKDKSGKVQTVAGEPVRPLLAALLARQEGYGGVPPMGTQRPPVAPAPSRNVPSKSPRKPIAP